MHADCSLVFATYVVHAIGAGSSEILHHDLQNEWGVPLLIERCTQKPSRGTADIMA